VSGSIVDVCAHGIPIEFLFVTNCVFPLDLTLTLFHGDFNGLTYDSVLHMLERLPLAYH
jgi:hypothetical protein